MIHSKNNIFTIIFIQLQPTFELNPLNGYCNGTYITTKVVNHYCSFDSIYIWLAFVYTQIISLSLVAMVDGVDMSSWGVLYAHPYEQYFISQGCIHQHTGLKKKIELRKSNSFLESFVFAYTLNCKIAHLISLRS